MRNVDVKLSKRVCATRAAMMADEEDNNLGCVKKRMYRSPAAKMSQAARV